MGPDKDAENLAKHGLSLGEFPGFDLEPNETIDDRRDYGEIRFRAFGRIFGGGYCLVYTLRDGKQRSISFRRAHEKEMRRYE